MSQAGAGNHGAASTASTHPERHGHPDGVFDDLMALIGQGSAVAIRRLPGEGDVLRSTLIAQAHAVAAIASGRSARPRNPGAGPDPLDDGGPSCVWVATRDRHRTVAAVLGCLRGHSVAPVEADAPAPVYDSLAAVCPPVLVLCDDPGDSVAAWAHDHGHPLQVVTPDLLAGPTGTARSTAARSDTTLVFFTSGTTGTPKRVDVDGSALLAAIRGVGQRLAIGPADTSLSLAPLNHVLGLVTSVLVALCSGGSVSFADPRHPRSFLAALPVLRPTWCAAAPGAHNIVYTVLSGARQPWPGLRLLRTTSAPIATDLETQLESYYAVPVLSSYAMTEAPGEIASQAPGADQRRGTVGRPTLCEVEIRSEGHVVPAGGPGEIWVRGPNVVRGARTTGGSGDARSGWLATGDLGSLDKEGFLRLTGRVNEVINQSGFKIWPSDVEAAALTDPAVGTAVAFPIPHDALGETVGLAVVPRSGQAVDRAALRRQLMSQLPRHCWPGAIVVCAEIPVSARGKVQRRMLWRQLPELRARLDMQAGPGRVRH
jgi:oxalate---CoA ligase